MAHFSWLFFLLILVLENPIIRQDKRTDLAVEASSQISYSNEIDYDVIRKWVEGKRVVSLGESTHGIGEFFALKARACKIFTQGIGV